MKKRTAIIVILVFAVIAAISFIIAMISESSSPVFGISIGVFVVSFMGTILTLMIEILLMPKSIRDEIENRKKNGR
jgi:protein-S-isoprenylcysteine O-methyltransferase Ste14